MVRYVTTASSSAYPPKLAVNDRPGVRAAASRAGPAPKLKPTMPTPAPRGERAERGRDVVDLTAAEPERDQPLELRNEHEALVARQQPGQARQVGARRPARDRPCTRSSAPRGADGR